MEVVAGGTILGLPLGTMKRQTALWLLLAAGAIALPGCEETAKKEVHVQPPAPAPQPVPAEVSQPLPVIEPAHPASLAQTPRPAIDVLVERVQASYDAGQKDYQAGNLD